MNPKLDLIRPHLLRSIDRMKRLVEIDAPGVVVGMEAWCIFKTTLAAYGSESGMVALDQIRDGNLQARGVCANRDCINGVDRGGSGICEPCEKELGIDDATFERILNEPGAHLGATEA